VSLQPFDRQLHGKNDRGEDMGDVFDDELAMVMASEGRMNLAGLIVTPVLTDGWGFSKPDWIQTAHAARNIAEKSGLRKDRIPPVTVGPEAESEKAGERKDSAGARLYITGSAP
jgi:hypothetical protein